MRVTKNRAVSSFIKEEKIKAQANGISFILKDSEQVMVNNMGCSGVFFDGDNPRLLTAIKKDEEKWLPVLVHETSHMDQFIEKISLWTTVEDNYIFDSWLAGGFFRKDRVMRVVEKTILLEADCERRALFKIEKNDLPINLRDYCRSANAYLFFHQAMVKKRSWYKKPPYDIKLVLKKMPDYILSDEEYLMDLSKKDLALFDCCF